MLRTATLLFSVTSALSLVSPVVADGWIPLFDGVSLRGWTQPNGEAIAAAGWNIEDGTIHLDRRRGRGGNIVTDREYGDFELVFEWKIAKRANSGIKYRVKDFDGRMLGLEYQIIDDQDYGNLRPTQTTASLYDLFEPKSHAILKPPGEFNRGAILVRGQHIEHWLNGHLLVDVEVASPSWRERVAGSKFAEVAGFGENALGRIMLTDHGDEVWYRNLFLRPIGPTPAPVACPVSLPGHRGGRLLGLRCRR